MAKTVAKVTGLVLLLVGVLGFTHVLDFLGAHLSPAHNLALIVSGVIALYFGFAGSLSVQKAFALSSVWSIWRWEFSAWSWEI